MKTPARGMRKLLADTLRAEANGNDLCEDDQGNIVVAAESRDGKLYKLGHVSMEVAYVSPDLFRAMVNRIKFDRHRS